MARILRVLAEDGVHQSPNPVMTFFENFLQYQEAKMDVKIGLQLQARLRKYNGYVFEDEHTVLWRKLSLNKRSMGWNKRKNSYFLKNGCSNNILNMLIPILPKVRNHGTGSNHSIMEFQSFPV